jgi:hypothetical protein
MSTIRRLIAEVRVWHETDLPKYFGDVRCWVNSGKHLLAASISPLDPERTYDNPSSDALAGTFVIPFHEKTITG